MSTLQEIRDSFKLESKRYESLNNEAKKAARDAKEASYLKRGRYASAAEAKRQDLENVRRDFLSNLPLYIAALSAAELKDLEVILNDNAPPLPRIVRDKERTNAQIDAIVTERIRGLHRNPAVATQDEKNAIAAEVRIEKGYLSEYKLQKDYLDAPPPAHPALTPQEQQERYDERLYTLILAHRKHQTPLEYKRAIETIERFYMPDRAPTEADTLENEEKRLVKSILTFYEKGASVSTLLRIFPTLTFEKLAAFMGARIQEERVAAAGANPVPHSAGVERWRREVHATDKLRQKYVADIFAECSGLSEQEQETKEIFIKLSEPAAINTLKALRIQRVNLETTSPATIQQILRNPSFQKRVNDAYEAYYQSTFRRLVEQANAQGVIQSIASLQAEVSEDIYKAKDVLRLARGLSHQARSHYTQFQLSNRTELQNALRYSESGGALSNTAEDYHQQIKKTLVKLEFNILKLEFMVENLNKSKEVEVPAQVRKILDEKNENSAIQLKQLKLLQADLTQLKSRFEPKPPVALVGVTQSPVQQDLEVVLQDINATNPKYDYVYIGYEEYKTSKGLEERDQDQLVVKDLGGNVMVAAAGQAPANMAAPLKKDDGVRHFIALNNGSHFLHALSRGEVNYRGVRGVNAEGERFVRIIQIPNPPSTLGGLRRGYEKLREDYDKRIYNLAADMIRDWQDGLINQLKKAGKNAQEIQQELVARPVPIVGHPTEEGGRELIKAMVILCKLHCANDKHSGYTIDVPGMNQYFPSKEEVRRAEQICAHRDVRPLTRPLVKADQEMTEEELLARSANVAAPRGPGNRS